MNILVTGGAGYIGSVLVGDLLQRADVRKVTVVDNLSYNQISLSHVMSDKRFNFIHGDVCDSLMMEPLIDEHDIIIPLACIVGMPACSKNPEKATQINLTAIKDLVKFSNDYHKIIFPTTNSGYGIGKTKNGELVECTEETPLRPVSLYGDVKVKAEEVLLEKGNAVTLRLATVFGASPRMRLDLLVNDFTYKACTDGYNILFESGFKRNFIHVKDVSKSFMFAIDNFDKMRGEAYNVGLSSSNLSKMELCEKIKEYVPNFVVKESEIREDPDKRNYIVSNRKLESLGWSPSYSLDDGIKELVKLYSIIVKISRPFTNL